MSRWKAFVDEFADLSMLTVAQNNLGRRCPRNSVLPSGQIQQKFSSKTRYVGKLDQFLPYLLLRPLAPLFEIEQHASKLN